MTKPFLSIIIVSYRMKRELPRTLFSLTSPYQKGISRQEFEVIVIDNGSPEFPTLDEFADLDLDLTIYRMSEPTKSPVPAINFGLNHCSGGIIGVFIDGARIVSPGLLTSARDIIAADDRHVVGSRGRYLGSNWQRLTMQTGYNQSVEDSLLENSGWTDNGYRLFESSVFDESSGPTWFDPVTESNTLFMSRRMWSELNGFDIRFVSAGGGLANLDMWRRACELSESIPTLLMGEGSFHQFHGGVATNGQMEVIDQFFAEYLNIRGIEFDVPAVNLKFVGTFHHVPPNKEITRLEFDTKRPPERIASQASARLASLLGPKSKRQLVKLMRRTKQVLKFHWGKVRYEKESIQNIRECDLFDSGWYVTKYPDVAIAGWDPAEHYFLYGASLRLSPGPNFDGAWYIDRYIDVHAYGVNPLLHYLHHGRGEGRRIRRVELDSNLSS